EDSSSFPHDTGELREVPIDIVEVQVDEDGIRIDRIELGIAEQKLSGPRVELDELDVRYPGTFPPRDLEEALADIAADQTFDAARDMLTGESHSGADLEHRRALVTAEPSTQSGGSF